MRHPAFQPVPSLALRGVLPAVVPCSRALRRLLRTLVLAGLALSMARTARAETRSLSLGQALVIARQRSPVLQKAIAQTEASRARADTSRGRLLPQITGTASYQRTTDNFVPRPGYTPNPSSQVLIDGNGNPITVINPQRAADPKYDFVNSYNFQLVANQLIYDFGATGDTLRADRESARAQMDTQRASVITTEYAVRNAFFLARAQRALVLVAEQTQANQQKHLAQIEAFVEVGTRPEIDLAQTRTDLANARVQLLQAQNNYANARESLKLVMGADDDVQYEVNDDTLPALPEEDVSLSMLVQRAYEARPELSSLARQVRAQSLRTRAVKGRYGPALTGTAATSKSGIELGNLTWNAYAGASLTWSLFESGSTYYAVREAEANQRGLEADLAQLALQIRVQLEQARLTVQTAKATVEAASEALSNAQARLALAEGRYQAGVGNGIELGDAQLALTQADAQRVQSEYNLAIARAQLLSALGKQ